MRTPPPVRDASVRTSRLAAIRAAVERHRLGPEPLADRRRLLVGAVVVVAVVLVGASAALAVSLTATGLGTSPPVGSTSAPAVTTVPPSNDHHDHRVASSGPRATPPRRSAPTKAPPAVGSALGDPVLAALSPSSGAAGQTVTISGSNFLSSDGVITVSFGGRPAPIDCPDQDTCTATVPTAPSGSSGPVRVTVTTSSGTSNPVTFTYT
ncbi:MAG TPA: IPT/TIG domain-containing protein [Acidimicrobiales bacterium]|nr:IPT/TIG domain-containing protein [Acidimicrobiales bacterium]